MSESPNRPMITRYADAERIYRALGYAPIPVGPDKRPLGKGWTKLSPTTDEIGSRLRRFPDANFGLLAGTEVPGDPEYVQAFVDIDHDMAVRFVRAVLGDVITAKVGSKGGTDFVRATKGLKSKKILGPDGRPAVEFMINTGMVVIPDSMHPSGQRYRWIGTPAAYANARQFPILNETKVVIIEAVVGNPHAWEIMQGGPEIAAHAPMLSLTSSGIANLTDDLAWLAECLGTLLPAGYEGNTKAEILGMLESAKAKGYGMARGSPRDYEPGSNGPVPLGYTKDGLYAFVDPVRQIIITASSNQLLSAQYLVGLASSYFWGEQFPSRRGIDSIAAGEALIAACRRRGPFNPSKVRGRGIWREGERVVVNLGDRVESRKYLYLCFEPIELDGGQEVDPARLLALLRKFNWRNHQDAMLMFGWFALAPICGVLNWRPHAFLYGPPRSGKTTIHALAATILAPLVVAADGQSSEAGIRQTLGPDSLPVILDEFESDQSGAVLRGVLRLARSASSADTAVLKGTPEGKALNFSLRVSFFFAAVNPRGMSVADQSRIVMLELLMHDNDSAKARLIAAEEAYFRSLGSAWCAYMVSMADKIVPTIDILEPLIESADRRHRQNISTLLGAGFVALHGRIPTVEEAKALADEYRPTIARHAEEIERDDALECLDFLMSHVFEGFPLGHWIATEHGRLGKGANGAEDVQRYVAMHDIIIRVDSETPGMLIRNGSPVIERIFRDTPWAGGAWQRALRKLAGAFSLPNPIQFPGSGAKARCIGIPLTYIPSKLPDGGRDAF